MAQYPHGYATIGVTECPRSFRRPPPERQQAADPADPVQGAPGCLARRFREQNPLNEPAGPAGTAIPGVERPRRGSLGALLLVFALVGLGVAGYLLGVRLFGEAPVCGPSAGCETVQQSKYSVVLGIPVAAWGSAFSLAVVVLAVRWWHAADRRALLAAYLLLLAGTLAVAVLTYLELFIIHAVCAWCVSYATAVVASLVTAGLALRKS